MGYTHYYFKIGKHDPAKWKAIFPQLSKDAAALIAASRVSIPNPTLKDNQIYLNGDEDRGEDHEELYLRHSAGGSCIKTARKPYDVVVTAILIRAVQLLGMEYMESGGLGEISSDGSWAEWGSGRKLVKKVFPDDDIICPWRE